MGFVKFPSIESFHTVRKGVLKYGWATDPVVYASKVKLHGTNAGVHVEGGQVFAQGRNQTLTTRQDNHGFAAWVETNQGYFAGLPDGITIFGEWCGKGIMKGASISQIPRNIWAPFAVQLGEEFITDPDVIEGDYLPSHPDIFPLPWHDGRAEVDFSDDESIRLFLDKVNRDIEEIEACDPFVEAAFGVQGAGEGLVYYPRGLEGRQAFSNLAFKAKGEKHRVVKQPKAAQIDPETAQSIEDFVELAVTPARLSQALEEGAGGELEMRKMGLFLAWIGRDLKKETVAELEASGLEWRQVAKPAMLKAKRWFLEQLESLP